jgi:peptidoglycan/LPS O-acetylase OafA/YrhL
MAFYFIFGLGLLMFRGRSSSGGRPLLALFVVFVMLVLALLHFTPLSKWPVAGFYLSYRNLEFAGGVVLGAGLNRGWGRGDARWSIGLIALGVMMIATAVEVFGLGEMHDYCFLAAAILIVGGAVAYERAATLPGISIMLLIGDASYSIYLSHPMMLSLVAQLWKRLPYGSGEAGLIAFSGMALVLSTVTGMLIHVFIERPLSRLLRYVKPPASHSLALWTGISGRTIREAS